MRIECNATDLHRAALKSARGAQIRGTLPILGHLLIQPDPEGITIVGTDLEVEVRAYCPAQVRDPDTITLPAKKLADICGGFEHGLVIETSGEFATLRADRSRFKLGTLPATDFPDFAPGDGAPLCEIDIDGAALHAALKKIVPAMAKSDVRYYMNGALIEIQGGEIRLVATDGHRLATCGMPLTGADAPDASPILPRRAALEMMGLLSHGGGARLTITETSVRLSTPATDITSKRIDARYPDWSRVCPPIQANQSTARIDRAALIGSLKRVASIQEGEFKGVKLTAAGDTCTLTGAGGGQEESEDSVSADISGPPASTAINAGYLLDALGAITGESAMIRFHAHDSPIRVTDPDDDNYFSVIMPMRI